MVNKLLQSLTISSVMSVYSGKVGKCYCGCSGTHRYNSAHIETAGKDRGYQIDTDEVNDRQVAKVLKVVQANFNEVLAEDMCHLQDRPGGSVTHFTAKVGERSYTVYLVPSL